MGDRCSTWCGLQMNRYLRFGCGETSVPQGPQGLRPRGPKTHRRISRNRYANFTDVSMSGGTRLATPLVFHLREGG